MNTPSKMSNVLQDALQFLTPEIPNELPQVGVVFTMRDKGISMVVCRNDGVHCDALEVSNFVAGMSAEVKKPDPVRWNFHLEAFQEQIRNRNLEVHDGICEIAM